MSGDFMFALRWKTSVGSIPGRALFLSNMIPAVKTLSSESYVGFTEVAFPKTTALATAPLRMLPPTCSIGSLPMQQERNLFYQLIGSTFVVLGSAWLCKDRKKTTGLTLIGRRRCVVFMEDSLFSIWVNYLACRNDVIGPTLGRRKTL